MSPSSPSFSNQAYPFPTSQGPLADSSSFQPINAYSTGPDPNPPSWGYPAPPTSMDRTGQYAPPQALPSIHSLERNPSGAPGAPAGYGPAPVGGAPGEPTDNGDASGTSHGWDDGSAAVAVAAAAAADGAGGGYRTWPQEASYSSMDGNTVSHAHAGGPVESASSSSSALRGAPPPSTSHHGSSASNPDLRENYAQLPPPTGAEPYAQNRYSQEPYTPIAQQAVAAQQLDTSMYASASYAQQQQQQHQQQQSQAQMQQYNQQPGSYVQEPTPPSTIPPLPRHTYTRTLVGPLSANACRLLDEHRKPGIFFLFQDLSIRTEGTFRLRLRLMNVGA